MTKVEKNKTQSESKEMIQLRNINEGVGNTRMERKKYQIYRDAILQAVSEAPQGILFKELPDRVRKLLPSDAPVALGSVTWHVTSVKLDLEARGLIQRQPGRGPQRLNMPS